MPGRTGFAEDRRKALSRIFLILSRAVETVRVPISRSCSRFAWTVDRANHGKEDEKKFGQKEKTPSCLTMTAFSGASKRVRTSGLPLRRRPLYPAELWMRMKDEGFYTLIEMMGEFSEAGEPVPIRRRTLYPAELWVLGNLRLPIIGETGEKVNSNAEFHARAYFLRVVPKETPMLSAALTACASCGTNLVLPATSLSGLWPTVLPSIATAWP